MFQDMFVAITGNSPMIQALLGGLVIAFLNMLGALLVLVWRRPSERLLNAGLGMAAGVMLTASFTSLIIPGIENGGIWPVLIGIIIGALILMAADHWIPHLHMIKGLEGGQQSSMKSVWLFIIAITIHNLPEGLAVGVGFGSGDLKNAIPLMLAIGIQNIPEGFAVSVSAIKAGMGSRSYATITGIRSGLVEIPLAVLEPGPFSLPRPYYLMRWDLPRGQCFT